MVQPEEKAAIADQMLKFHVAAVVSGIVVGLFTSLLAGVIFGSIAFAFTAMVQAGKNYHLSYPRLIDAWCVQNGWRRIEDFRPRNMPYSRSGGESVFVDAIACDADGLATVAFTWFAGSESGGPALLTIMQITGPRLPVSGLYLGRKRLIDPMRDIVGMQNVLFGQRTVTFESIRFDSGYEVIAENTADEIWLRRTFDPVTIDAIDSGALEVPDLTYYAGSFWFLRNGSVISNSIESIAPWRTDALNLIRRVGRVSV